jgi:hypothetical protein
MNIDNTIDFDIESLLQKRAHRLNYNAILAGIGHVKSFKIINSVSAALTNAKLVAKIIALTIDPDSLTNEQLESVHIAVALAIENDLRIDDYGTINLQLNNKTFKVLGKQI